MAKTGNLKGTRDHKPNCLQEKPWEMIRIRNDISYPAPTPDLKQKLEQKPQATLEDQHGVSSGRWRGGRGGESKTHWFKESFSYSNSINSLVLCSPAIQIKYIVTKPQAIKRKKKWSDRVAKVRTRIVIKDLGEFSFSFKSFAIIPNTRWLFFVKMH